MKDNLQCQFYTFAYATQFNALPGSSRAPRVQYYLEWAPPSNSSLPGPFNPVRHCSRQHYSHYSRNSSSTLAFSLTGSDHIESGPHWFPGLVFSTRAHTSLRMSGGAISASKYRSSTLVGFSPVTALFSSGFSFWACDDLAQTGAAYSATEQHNANAVVLMVLAFAPHFELENFLSRLLRVATFIFVLCMCSLQLSVRSRVTSRYFGCGVLSSFVLFHSTFIDRLASLFIR